MTVRSRAHSSFQGASSWEAAEGGGPALLPAGGVCSPPGGPRPAVRSPQSGLSFPFQADGQGRGRAAAHPGDLVGVRRAGGQQASRGLPVRVRPAQLAAGRSSRAPPGGHGRGRAPPSGRDWRDPSLCEPVAWGRLRPEASMGHPRVPEQTGSAGACGTTSRPERGTVSTWGLRKARGAWRGGGGGTSGVSSPLSPHGGAGKGHRPGKQRLGGPRLWAPDPEAPEEA